MHAASNGSVLDTKGIMIWKGRGRKRSWNIRSSGTCERVEEKCKLGLITHILVKYSRNAKRVGFGISACWHGMCHVSATTVRAKKNILLPTHYPRSFSAPLAGRLELMWGILEWFNKSPRDLNDNLQPRSHKPKLNFLEVVSATLDSS